MMNSLAIQLYLHLSKIINLHNPLLLMTEEEEVPTQFCGGIYFPIVCSRYSANDVSEIAHQIQSQTIVYNPIFIFGGEHKDLIMELNDQPLLFSFNHVWVMPMEYASLISLRLDNNILFYDYHAKEGEFNIYDSYAIKGERPIRTSLFQWKNDSEGQMNHFNMQVRTLEGRSNLKGSVLKVSPVNIKTEGDEIDILMALQYKLNFTLQKVESREKRWGSKYKNGTWNGYVGMLVDNKIDLVAEMMINKQRQEVVDFCWPTEKITITLMSSKYAIPKLNIWAYVDIFPLTAWIVGLFTLIVAALCFSMSNHESVVQGLTLMWRLFLQIGYDLPANGIASRALLMTSALCLSMVFIYYETDLTATMTVEPPKLNIRSFEDVERLGYRVAIKTGFGNMPYNLLKAAPNDSAMKRMFENNEFIVKQNDEEMLQEIEGDSKTLLFHYAGTPKYKETIEMDIVEAATLPRAFSFKKGSEFAALFNYHFLKMQEIGMTERIKKKWARDPDHDYGMAEPIVLGYDNLFFPFGWLALGIVVAVPILVAEVFGKLLKASKHQLT